MEQANSIYSAWPASVVNAAYSSAGDLAKRWHLSIEGPLPGATCSVVLAARDKRGVEFVLKVPFAGTEECDSLPVMVAFSEHGGVSVLRHDKATGAVLMPRLRPGRMLIDFGLDEDSSVDICAQVISRLRLVRAGFALTIERWFEELNKEQADPLGLEAHAVVSHLLATSPPAKLVHGDLHHFNILSHGDTWIAIDPKGVLADPAFEVAAFMRNPAPNPLGPEGMARRLRRFAERLGDPPERLWGWSFAQTVLCGLQSDAEEFGASWKKAAQAIFEVRGEFVD